MNLIETASAQFNASNLSLSPALVGTSTWQGLVGGITTWVLIIAGVAAFFYLIYSGFLYITAAGNPDAAKKGQQGIINAIIGIVIIALSYAIITAIINFLTVR